MTHRTFVTLVFVFSATLSAHGQNYRQQDAGLGGLAGAVVGGIIGHQNNETAEGAIIGGTVGAIAGSIFGEKKDRQVQQQRYYQQQAHQAAQHEAWRRQQVARGVTINDVVNMSSSGISDAVILNQIRARGVVDDIGTREIIAMHNRGVSETVITAMQNTPQATPTRYDATNVARVPPRPQPPRETVIVDRRPVIVREEIRVMPPPVYRPHPRVHHATRPAFPAYPTRVGFRAYW